MQRATSRSWAVTGGGLQGPGQPSHLICGGQTGYRFICAGGWGKSGPPWRFGFALWKQEWLDLAGLWTREALGMTWLLGPLYLRCTTQPPGLLLKLPMPRPDPKTNEVRISGWDLGRGGPTVLLTFKTSELVSYEHEVYM